MDDTILIEKRCDNGIINTYYVLNGVNYLYIDNNKDGECCGKAINQASIPKCILKNLTLQDKYRSYTFLAWLVQKSVGGGGWQ